MSPDMIEDDIKFHVKTKISALWVSTLMCYLYADYIALLSPGMIQRIMDGNLGGWETTPGFLLGSAVIMVIPSVLIYLTLALKSTASRWLNIIFGVLYIAIALITTVNAWKYDLYYYILFGTLELVLTGLIVWYAWRWSKQEVENK
jgi:hypothetical protein